MGDFNTAPEVAGLYGALARRIAALEIAEGRQYAESLGEVSTSSTTPVDLGGPSLVIEANTSGRFLNVYTEIEGKSAVVSSNPTAYLAITGLATQKVIAVSVNLGQENTYLRVEQGQSQPGLFGTASMIPITSSPLTITMLYANGGAAATSFFRNRKLWAYVT